MNASRKNTVAEQSPSQRDEKKSPELLVRDQWIARAIAAASQHKKALKKS